MANEFGLREQREVADAMGLFERLLNLDGTWTDYLQNAESIPDSDVEVLRELADDMDQLLVECEPQARRVSEIFDEHPQLVEETFEDLMSSPEITDETRRSWDRLVERHEGIVPLEVRAMSHVSRTVPATRRELSEKMSHIEAGEFIPGDLPPLFWCGVMIGMTIGMAMSGWWPGAFGMAIAAGTYCGRFAKFPSPL